MKYGFWLDYIWGSSSCELYLGGDWLKVDRGREGEIVVLDDF